ncbi:unnamed protein product [Pleuronectes platessa]|uniref:Uncharacterized protein n=1 Tax=Pleuronectes platessa TaxID=8262 RepID=A0A9N7YUW2_PLEPL|nr:unnamed protein product [Pleuronectes platessa]
MADRAQPDALCKHRLRLKYVDTLASEHRSREELKISCGSVCLNGSEEPQIQNLESAQSDQTSGVGVTVKY